MKILSLFLLGFPMFLFSQTDLEKAQKLISQKQYELARPLLESASNKYPEDLQIIELLGDCYSHAKQWDSASKTYHILVKKQPSVAGYHYKFGGAWAMKASESNKLSALRMIDGIESEFLKTIQLDPKHLEARWALVELYLQLPAIVGGGESKASKYANQLQRLSAVDGFLSKGHIAEYYKRYESAEEFYKQAITAGQSKNSYQKLADLYQNKMKQPLKAKAVWAEYNRKRG